MTPPSPTRRALLAVGGMVVATLGAGCGAVSAGLSSGAVSSCFKSLPAARTAIHSSSAHLLGVHRLSADQVPERLKNETSLPPEIDTVVCAVAFKGTFAPGQVEDAQQGASGTYAVVLVDEKKLTVLLAYVGDHLPRDLKGRTV